MPLRVAIPKSEMNPIKAAIESTPSPRKTPESQNETGRLGFGLELTSVLDAVALGERDTRCDPFADVADDTAEVATRDVRRHHDTPLHVLPADEVGSAVLHDLGQAAEWHARAGGHVDSGLPDRVQVSHVTGDVSEDQRIHHLPVDDLTNFDDPASPFPVPSRPGRPADRAWQEPPD